MRYIKIVDGQIAKYPYTEWDLRSDNPNISYPNIIGYGFFADAGAYPVQEVARPEIEYTQNVVEGEPEQIGSGLWQQTWVVSNATEEQIAQRIASKWEAVREKRNRLLSTSDWTQLPDNPLSQEKELEWATYRQQLRDITEQENPFFAVFPVPPLP